jgi:hypothetical protein
MKNILEELLMKKEKCRWRENTIAGDICTNEQEWGCYFLSDRSYVFGAKTLCACDYQHLNQAYRKERRKEDEQG